MTSEIDWTRVASLASSFVATTAEPPSVPLLTIQAFRWAPERSTLPATLQVLLEWWEGLPRQDDLPLAEAIDPLSLRDVIGYLMILEPEAQDHGLDFRYRLYGTAIAARSGFDLTGKLIGETDVDSSIKHYFIACYRAVAERRDALYAAHEAPPEISVAAWSRLMLPFCDGDRHVTKIVVGNLPGERRPRGDLPPPVYGSGS